MSVPRLNATSQTLVANQLASYTPEYRPEAERVTTFCIITAQTPFPCFGSDDQCQVPNASVPISNLFLTDVDYDCEWSSRVTNVTGYTQGFTRHINTNLESVAMDMEALYVDVLNVFETRATPNIVPSDRPSTTPTQTPTNQPTDAPVTSAPTSSPTLSPSSAIPSEMPSLLPSLAPSTFAPTAMPQESPTGGSPDLGQTDSPTDIPTQSPATSNPTGAPSQPPTPGETEPPSLPPSGEASASQDMTIVLSVVVAAGVGGIFIFLIWFRRRRRLQESDSEGSLSSPVKEATGIRLGSGGRRSRGVNGAYQDLESDGGGGPAPGVISPSISLVSRQSLLSAGESGLGDDSDVEVDGTRNLQDEFDLYKDQNLEQMRSDVEENVSGFEGIMSEAVTRALMGDDYPELEPSEKLHWGCPENAPGIDIEASVLCEVNEWLFRNDQSTADQKKVFMQDILNRMVTSVRFGVLPADDASRAIHESAALLGLPLAHQLPTATLIISGMMKTGGVEPMKAILSEFGDIDVAAVASGHRGFGIIRYRSSKSADRVMRRYRKGEIVIQDVAVQIKALMRSGQVESRKARS